jgi:hypothetical protein
MGITTQKTNIGILFIYVSGGEAKGGGIKGIPTG